MGYQCINPVVIMVFNRPDSTMKVFRQIKSVRPPKLYIVSDGPRKSVEEDRENVERCRDIAKSVNWPCDVVEIFSSYNLGGKKRIVTGLNEVFSREEVAIILEDDCVPTQEFFEFCDWGLRRYETESRIGIISGSNLLDYLGIPSDTRAGFSRYINCWGWASWRRTWDKFDPLISLQELRNRGKHVLQRALEASTQRLFWMGVFSHAIYSSSIWDFYLQYAFFEHDLVSVYPIYNLVENIGFGTAATHTKKVPEFVARSKPDKMNVDAVMKYHEPAKIEVNASRDKAVLETVYGYSILAAARLTVSNRLRLVGVL